MYNKMYKIPVFYNLIKPKFSKKLQVKYLIERFVAEYLIKMFKFLVAGNRYKKFEQKIVL